MRSPVKRKLPGATLKLPGLPTRDGPLGHGSSIITHLGTSGAMRAASEAAGADLDPLSEDELGESVERGLANLGNTCYMNAVLQARPAALSALIPRTPLCRRTSNPNPNPASGQALSHCPPLTHYLRCCTALYLPGLATASDRTVRQAGGARGQPYLRCKMTEALTATLLELGGCGGGSSAGGGGGSSGGQQPTVVQPTELLDAVHELMPTFRRHEQQDAQELLRLLLSVMHEQLQVSCHWPQPQPQPQPQPPFPAPAPTASRPTRCSGHSSRARWSTRSSGWCAGGRR